jgi:biotin synthase
MKTVSLQIATEDSERQVLDLSRNTQGILSHQRFRAKNPACAGTSGVSHENCRDGFTPAYLDTQRGHAMTHALHPSDSATAAVLHRLQQGRWDDSDLSSALQFRGSEQAVLFTIARQIRDQSFPDRPAELRSVIEISNICKQRCNFCNIGAPETAKYVIQPNDLLQLVDALYHERGRRVFLLQSGENNSRGFVNLVVASCRLIAQALPDVTLVLCIGNLTREQFRALRDTGVARYILKIESSNPQLYHLSKPHDNWDERKRCLDDLLELDFKVGSGIIVGLPMQRHDDLVADLTFMHRLPLSMVSATVFVPGAGTVYEREPPGDVHTTLNFMALLRIMHPAALMPTTSSLEKLLPDGQLWGLMAGANSLTIHDGTPERLQALFPIYDNKRFRPQDDRLLAIASSAGLRPVNHSLI